MYIVYVFVYGCSFCACIEHS